MKHYQRIQNAVNFIETNLGNDFSLVEVSQAAFSSLSYMHRVFYQMTGFTMKEYIRQRRLSLAVSTLHNSQQSVLDIALASGFHSAESFSRAFKKQFGIPPNDCRYKKQEVNICQPLDIEGQYQFSIPKNLDFELTLEAVSFQQTGVIGFTTHTTLKNSQQVIDICNFANEILQTGKMATHFDLNSTPIYGIYTNMTDESDFDYTIAGLQTSCTQPVPEMVKHHIEASTYAKFTLNRNDRIKEAWHYIYGVWFPQIESLRTHGYDFEVYHPEHTCIYIPMSDVPTPLNSSDS